MPLQNALNRLFAGALFACMAYLPIAAQSNSSASNATATPAAPSEAASGYDLPPKNILDVMLAPRLQGPR